MLARVGLEAKAFDAPVKSFSKGMRQKLGIAIALSKDALAIILDEPTSGLDPKSAAEFMELLNGLRDERRAILMSTHDIFHAKDAADTVGIMKSGVLVGQLDRSQLLTADWEAIYLAYMNSDITMRQASS